MCGGGQGMPGASATPAPSPLPGQLTAPSMPREPEAAPQMVPRIPLDQTEFSPNQQQPAAKTAMQGGADEMLESQARRGDPAAQRVINDQQQKLDRQFMERMMREEGYTGPRDDHEAYLDWRVKNGKGVFF